MPREDKVTAVAEVKEKIEKAEAVVFTDYRGLTVSEMAELRRSLKQAGVEYKVVKNTLTRRAVDELELEGLHELLDGPTALAFGYDDPVTPAKLLFDFSKKSDVLELKGALLGSDVYDAERTKALASLPAREVLLGQLLGAMQGPIAGFVRVMAGPASAFARVLKAIADQKAASGEAPPAAEAAEAPPAAEEPAPAEEAPSAEAPAAEEASAAEDAPAEEASAADEASADETPAAEETEAQAEGEAADETGADDAETVAE